MSEEFVRKDYHDEIIKRMADFTEKSFARQEAVLAEIKNETKDFNARIDSKLNRIKAIVNDRKKFSYVIK